jgi:hypothetical protein
MCTVPKHLLDDLETNFPARTKSGMLKALADALSKGKYPGWERERGSTSHPETSEDRPCRTEAHQEQGGTNCTGQTGSGCISPGAAISGHLLRLVDGGGPSQLCKAACVASTCASVCFGV